jgi:hypothetical protein
VIILIYLLGFSVNQNNTACVKAISIASPSLCHLVLATKSFVSSYEIRHSVSYKQLCGEYLFRENRLSNVVETTTLAEREGKEGGQNWLKTAPHCGL